MTANKNSLLYYLKETPEYLTIEAIKTRNLKLYLKYFEKEAEREFQRLTLVERILYKLDTQLDDADRADYVDYDDGADGADDMGHTKDEEEEADEIGQKIKDEEQKEMEEHCLPDEMIEAELIKEARFLFLSGKDEQFDYSIFERTTRWVDHKQAAQDQEDSYFDAV